MNIKEQNRTEKQKFYEALYIHKSSKIPKIIEVLQAHGTQSVGKIQIYLRQKNYRITREQVSIYCRLLERTGLATATMRGKQRLYTLTGLTAKEQVKQYAHAI